MNRLDERLKERARREDCPVPQGFDGRMDAIWDFTVPWATPSTRAISAGGW